MYGIVDKAGLDHRRREKGQEEDCRLRDVSLGAPFCLLRHEKTSFLGGCDVVVRNVPPRRARRGWRLRISRPDAAATRRRPPPFNPTPSGFRIGSIEVNTAPLLAQSGDPTASWVQQALPGQLARVFGAHMAPGAPGATLNARVDSIYLGLGGSANPDTIKGVATLSGGGGPAREINRACDRDILSGHGRTRAAGAGLPGPGDGAVAGLRLQAEEEIGSLRRRQARPKEHRFLAVRARPKIRSRALWATHSPG